ncbi:MAG TPA: DUF4349 domain-containing protein, partial [Actinobacteria bacterium]|nr:DUF4349 domain-containing protein [Actinomycetota bacterium]
MSMLARIRESRLFLTVAVILFLIMAGTLSSRGLLENSRTRAQKIDEGRVSGRPGALPSSQVAKLEPEMDQTKDIASRSENETFVSDLPRFDDKVIKTGSVTLKVKKSKFGQTFDKIVMMARANGGYIAGSNSASSGDRIASGTLTIKIPSKNFEVAIGRLRRMGKVTAINIDSQDVSAEYVDLKSRLSHWRAQETILMNLMDKAQNIADSVTIQQQLSEIQLQIEQVAGRLNYLKDKTDFASIQVTINEPGVIAQPLDRWGFS